MINFKDLDGNLEQIKSDQKQNFLMIGNEHIMINKINNNDLPSEINSPRIEDRYLNLVLNDKIWKHKKKSILFYNQLKEIQMKKSLILTAIAIILMTCNVYSGDSRDMLQIGAKVGANFSNVYDSQGEEFNADGKMGLVLGGFVSIPVGKYIGIQSELLLSQKGFQGTGKLLGSPYKFNRTTTYIDIPILFAFKPSEAMTILAGPQFSYLAKQSDEFDNGITNLQQVQEFKNENIRDNTLCFLGGVDLNLENLVIGARVGWDLYNNNGDGTDTTPRYKNVWYQLTLGYRLFFN